MAVTSKVEKLRNNFKLIEGIFFKHEIKLFFKKSQKFAETTFTFVHKSLRKFLEREYFTVSSLEEAKRASFPMIIHQT